MDRESLRYVAEDLDYLLNGWGPDIAEPDIRRGSAVLRLLLVEGVYGQAWRTMGLERQPKVIAVDLDNLIGKENINKVVCAMAWGAHFRGMYMASPCLNEGTQPIGTATPPIRENGYPGEKVYSLSEYIESTSGLAGGVRVNRREIIKYVANVKGGVHLGQKTKSAEKELVKKLTKFERVINVNITDGILVELVSIAQAIGSSDDAMQLADAIQRGPG